MHYDEYHNHKWSRNLGYARRLLMKKEADTFYHGEDLPENDVYPGMRVMAAYWVSVEHEMRMRLRILLEGSGHPEWREDAELLAQRDDFVARFLDDMRALVVREEIVPQARLDALAAAGYDTPDDWADQMATWQTASEAALVAGEIPVELAETWFDSCLRSVANYNRYLIWGAVAAAAIYRRKGAEALRAAVDATADAFMWEISREFYVHVLPAAGFQDLDELMELGLRGMYSDQYYTTGEEEELEEGLIKRSILRNCELGGVFQRVAEWNGLPKTALGYAVCRYCEVHGAATMNITIPPMYHPTYRRVRSVGMDDTECLFELTLTEADDMERLMSVHARIFGETM
ncbi:MAG: hypothetical protein JXB35_12625 [Anaerolineae bacterium]|nr:hypothetical protein [Anaerolineae bacterium]